MSRYHTEVVGALLSVLSAILGLLVSLLLAARHARLRIGSIVCSDTTGVLSSSSCDAVLSSKYAYVGGVPLAYLGVGFYCIALAIALIALAADGRGAGAGGGGNARRAWRSVLLIVGLVGTIASAGFVTLQFTVIRGICPLCMLSALASTTLLLGAILWRRSRSARPHPLTVAVALACCIPVAGVLGVALMRQFATGQGDDELLARFGAREIRLSDMRRDTPEPLESLDRSGYEARKAYVRRKLGGLALEAEARKFNLTGKQLIQRDVDDLVAREDRPTIERTAAELSPRDPASRQKIITTMLADAREARLEALVDSVLAKYPHQSLVRLPPGRQVTLAPDLAPTWRRDGPANAPLQLTVFSDFQCSICAELDGVLDEVKKRLGDQLAITYLPFPLRDHEHAELAAVVGDCVGTLLGPTGFRVYKSATFARRGEITPDTILNDARALGLSSQVLDKCRQDPGLLATIRITADQARTVKLDGAPTLLLNGRVLGGFMNPETLETHLREALARK